MRGSVAEALVIDGVAHDRLAKCIVMFLLSLFSIRFEKNKKEKKKQLHGESAFIFEHNKTETGQIKSCGLVFCNVCNACEIEPSERASKAARECARARALSLYCKVSICYLR